MFLPIFDASADEGMTGCVANDGDGSAARLTNIAMRDGHVSIAAA